ncbi:MAG: hypothetical protein V3S89_10545 [Desulfobacterales bacterium]
MNEISAVPCSLIAWAGWKTRIPEHWRPLRVENQDAAGTFMIGDAAQATVQVKWWTPDPKGFDGARWLEKRLRSFWKGARAEADAPAGDRFDQTLWLPEARTRKGAKASVWYGYSAGAQLLIEVVVNSGAGPDVKQLAETILLPSLNVSDRTAPIRWAVYDTSFESPPGYVIDESRLNLGAISLVLKQGKQQLMVCQIYPGGAALEKAPLLEWLGTTALKSKRKSTPIDGAGEVKIDSFKGLKRESTERLPFPLGRIEPLHCLAMIAHDETLDRLLLAEHISPVWTEEGLVSEAIRAMNWTQRDPAGP